MTTGTIKFLITAALTVHGLGHGGALGALLWLKYRPRDDSGGWLAARSWLLPSLSNSTASRGRVLDPRDGRIRRCRSVVLGHCYPQSNVEPTRSRILDRLARRHLALLRDMANVQYARRYRRQRRRPRYSALDALAGPGDLGQVVRALSERLHDQQGPICVAEPISTLETTSLSLVAMSARFASLCSRFLV